MNENIKRLKGAKDLVFDAVEETTNLVERMHALAAKKSTQPLTLIEPLTTLTKGVKTVHDSIASGNDKKFPRLGVHSTGKHTP